MNFQLILLMRSNDQWIYFKDFLWIWVGTSEPVNFLDFSNLSFWVLSRLVLYSFYSSEPFVFSKNLFVLAAFVLECDMI